MTRRSKRELERALEEMGARDPDGDSMRIVVREAVIATGWSGVDSDDAEPGETIEVETTEVEVDR